MSIPKRKGAKITNPAAIDIQPLATEDVNADVLAFISGQQTQQIPAPVSNETGVKKTSISLDAEVYDYIKSFLKQYPYYGSFSSFVIMAACKEIKAIKKEDSLR
ncbi:MAG: hypothetical protein HC842_00535 [Cytophagales bacterium]|nr:hypothetical protein [Cytophagales bacterium]